MSDTPEQPVEPAEPVEEPFAEPAQEEPDEPLPEAAAEVPAAHDPNTLQGMLHALIDRVDAMEAKAFGKGDSQSG